MLSGASENQLKIVETPAQIKSVYAEKVREHSGWNGFWELMLMESAAWISLTADKLCSRLGEHVWR